MHFSDLIADIESLHGDPDTKARVLSVISEHAGLSIYISTRQQLWERRDALAEQMRKVGYRSADMARVFRHRLGVSRATAWRWAQQYNEDT